jgi:hypothetical protein
MSGPVPSRQRGGGYCPDLCSAIRNAQVTLSTLIWVVPMLLCVTKFLKCVASNVGPSLVKYKHGRQLIVASPKDQLLLQQTGMMSGRQMLMFNWILVGLTGIGIHSTSTMLATLQDNQMPDCTITMVKLLLNKTMQPRRVFRVARWTQVI